MCRQPEIERRVVLALAGAGLASTVLGIGAAEASDPWARSPWRSLTGADWRRRLSPAAFDVLRRDGTEPPWSSPLLQEHRRGAFVCAGCALALFKSEWKFESGTGWPSFFTVIPGAVLLKQDMLLGYARTEYHCARCLGHQGHIFRDGPKPTGLRHCNDGVALRFIPA